ncbi:MAG: translation initiation factor IF-2 [Kiloniellales bacterium]|nr:translation initiation factor IF-2 [Kiloniellales bacterium]
MTTKEGEAKKPLKLNRPGRLELKKTVETGQVRQSFSHGRTKAVTVEVKRTRSFERGAGGRMAEVKAPPEGFDQATAEAAEALGVAEVTTEAPRTLTDAERAGRMRALESAKRDEERRQIEAEQEAERRQREAEDAARRAEQEAEAQRVAEAEAEKNRAELEERRRIEEEARKQLEEEEKAKSKEAPAEKPAAPAAKKPAAAAEEPAKTKPRKGGGAPAKTPAPRRGGDERRRHGKLTITQALTGEDGMERVRSLASVRRQRERERQRQAGGMEGLPQKVIREVVVPETITVQELANRMAERGAEVIKTLMKMGVMATINQTIDADTAELVVSEFGHKLKRVSAADVEIGLKGDDDKAEDLKARPSVVTVMGHVDHGKTSLLDALRATDVVAHEAGGITQHIGAYQVTLASGDKVTFIDTPGHAAFTEMRSRGANVTDIVVLVVAADDGIKDQTVEAINHAKAAKVPIVVAINKIDKPEANPDRVKQELLQHDLVVEDMGGEILAVPVSAVEGTGLDKLVEALLLQAELLELKANPERAAEGVVIEAKLEQGRGSVATVLVQRGTLKVGDIFVTGSESGRVRALLNDHGEKVEEAGPSAPVEVLGLAGTPLAGDDFVVVESEARAREIASFRKSKVRDQGAAANRVSLEQLISKIQEGETKRLPVVIKSDVQGSVEAIVGALEKLGTDEVAVQVLHTGVGGINESDITLARASGAMVIGFNVRANPQARELARRDDVEIRYYSIIYNVVDEMKAALSGMLAPSREEKFLGYAEIREVFNITKVGKVAGCMITEGQVKRGAKVRLLRDDVVIHDGTLKTLRRFKDEVREVKDGYECGMAFENYQDIQVGDKIECYEVEEKARQL